MTHRDSQACTARPAEVSFEPVSAIPSRALQNRECKSAFSVHFAVCRTRESIGAIKPRADGDPEGKCSTFETLEVVEKAKGAKLGPETGVEAPPGVREGRR